MEIAIIGGGSLGLMWCSRLLLAGITPTLIVRTDEQRDLLREQGLLYTEKGDSYRLNPVVESLTSFQGQLPLWTVMTVKQTHITNLMPFLQSHNNKKGYISPVINGLGHVEKLERVFSLDQIILCSTSDGALRHEPNHVERTGFGETWLGLHGQVEVPNSLKDVIVRFQKAGFTIQWDAQIMMRLWRKCVINCAINPLTAILNIENGELLRSEATLNLMREIYEEATMVAQAKGYQFNEDLWQEIATVCRNTSRNRSSMLQDLLNKRKTEIDYINGYIAQAGKQAGIATPYNHMLQNLIHSKEQLQRTHDELE